MKHAALIAALAIVSFAGAARADGDAEAGKKLFAKCAACHATEAGKNKLGPTLHGVVGHASASVAGFAYSDALKGAGKTWDPATLDAWLAEPKALVPGTKMIFPGLKNEQERANLIAYLSTLK